jgi:FkbM family methyltransferase
MEWALDVRIVHPDAIALLFEQEHLRRVFRAFKIDCVFDVGANKGQYAEMTRRNVGYAGPIVSFEPTPEAAQALRRKASEDEHWFVEQMALDEAAGTKSFNVAADSEFSASGLEFQVFWPAQLRCSTSHSC